VPRRGGITLVESLVVFAIITIGVAITLCAVQRVRETVMRTRCANNLRAIALAAHQYHDSFGVFPSGRRHRVGDTDFMGWLTQLLPYVEQEQIWDKALEDYARQGFPFGGPTGPHPGLGTVVTIFGCPDDWRTYEAQIVRSPPGNRVALTDYLGVEGLDLFSCDGVLFEDSAIRISDITDGTSQTLLAGERPPSNDFRFGWWYAGLGQDNTGSLATVLGVTELDASGLTQCPTTSYRFGLGQIDNPCDVFHFWSLHIGGANFVFADASVRYLSYNAASLMPALATRSGGEASDVP
jgi:prepilin-type processing-associated H-X9-DG protein